jgi:hypothetical protein
VSTSTRTPRRRSIHSGVVASVLVVGVLVVATIIGGGAADPSDAQLGGVTSSTIARNPVPTTPAPSLTSAGRLAYVTPTGEVVVADSDGSSPVTIGTGAVADANGLAPIAWSGGGDLVAYVRNDGALVLASADASEAPIVAATDAVVSAQAQERILSFDSTGTGVAYLEAGVNGTSQAAVAVYDGPSSGTITPMTDPATRIPTAFEFSPMDPALFLQSLDADTGANLPLAFVDPFSRTPFSASIGVDDPAFAPDGAFVYGVISSGLDQLARVDIQTAQVEFIRNQEQICHPQPSPDGTKVAYGAGRVCNELWVVNADGTDPEMVARVVGQGNTFAVGSFSWSLDGATVTHAACNRTTGGKVTCAGPYVDIDVASGKVTRRAVAGAVEREFRPLIKPLKVKVKISGPLRYDGGMVVPTGSDNEAPQLTQLPRDAIVKVKAVDERDQRRSFDLELLTTQDSRYMTGTVHVVDPEAKFDQDITIFGQILAQSARYAVFRGIWVRTSSMPLKSGRIDLTVYR